MKIKIINTDLVNLKTHEKIVNDFLKSDIQVISIDNNTVMGRVFKNGTSEPEIVTFIVYKELAL